MILCICRLVSFVFVYEQKELSFNDVYTNATNMECDLNELPLL